jgi:hypothetical protein
MAARDDIGDDRGARRLMKGLGHCHAKGGDVNMPGLNRFGKNQQRQYPIHARIRYLRKQNLLLARVAVGDTAGDRRQKENWNRLHAAH